MKSIVLPGEFRAHLLKLLKGNNWGSSVLLAAPGTIPSRLLDAGAYAAYATGEQPLPIKLRREALQAFLAFFREDIDKLEQTEEWEELLQESLAALDHRSTPIHLCKDAIFNRWLLTEDSSLLLNGPIASEFLTQKHLRVHGTPAKKMWEMYLDAVRQGDDVTDDFSECIANSWACKPTTLHNFYFATLFRYFGDAAEETADANPILEELATFQRDAYRHAKRILAKYGGVFLSDVVGLGKTWIAMALLCGYHETGQHAVVVASPSILDAWEELSRRFRLPIGLVSIGKLSELEKYSDREILVIDESHAFRNTGTQRYEELDEWLRPEGAPSRRKVILLSATPQNNRAKDVLNQLALFPDIYEPLPYPQANRALWERNVKKDASNLKDVLQYVVVRRTRHMLKEAQATGPDGSRITFPTRVSGAEQQLRYDPTEEYGKEGYQILLEAMAQLKLPGFSLGEYLIDQAQDSGHDEVADILKSRGQVRGLYRSMLLKRMESSAHALQMTLTRQLKKISKQKTALTKERIVIYGDILQSTIDFELDSETKQVPSSFFHEDRLLDDYLHDSRLIERMCNVLEHAVDAKVERLFQYLKLRLDEGHKILVFSEYKETLTYLNDQLVQRGLEPGLVHGGVSNVMKVVRQFAPIANNADPGKNELNLLLTSDVLAEGVNLQDADTLVNYELHWNPVRLIQRAGRIDRIGSQAEEIHIASFLPDTQLERELGIHQVVKERFDEIMRVFGADGHALPTDEKFDPAGSISAFDGTYEQREVEQESNMFGTFDAHLARLMEERRQRPETFKNIEKMRESRRILIPHQAHFNGRPANGFSAIQVGSKWFFVQNDALGSTRQMRDSEALDALWELVDKYDDVDLKDYGSKRRALARKRVEKLRAYAETLLKEQRRHQLSPHQTQRQIRIENVLSEAKSRATENERIELDSISLWYKRQDLPRQLTREISKLKLEEYSEHELVAWAKQRYKKYVAKNTDGIVEPFVVGYLV